ncbi:MAG: glucans biosynthesis glucosyltransferase MdoH, partial [Chromatocurvus sp.]
MKTAAYATPPASPLAMPTQILTRCPTVCHARRDPSTLIARWLTFGGSLTLTVAASRQMYLVTPLNNAADASAWVAPWVSVLLWLLLGLFAATFAWISLSASAAVAGLLCSRQASPPDPIQASAGPATPLRGRTALVMPIYNEDATSACASLAAMGEDLGKQGLQAHFDIFVLSDSNRGDILAIETTAVEHLRRHLLTTLPVWYRHREQNTDRKAGNIRDFIERWGSGYDYMVVLDADSLIAAESLATLVREMDADPDTGILQTLPRLYGGKTLFARLQQFSAAAYGHIFSRGLAAWQGHDGNYWGHNAIIRTRAFAAAAGLPTLPGPRPFGGEIRSHDFVEAALIRRAGWSVRMMPELSASWEQCPPTLLDAAIRDRRWAQGNIQHLAIMAARGLRWPNRVHMLMGVMNYLTSLLWLAMVLVGLVLSTQFALVQQSLSVTAAPAFDAAGMIGLFIFTVSLLLLPKLLGLVLALRNPGLRGGCGRVTFFLSALCELLFSVLYAPLFMLIHSGHLWEIARGRDSGWSAQQRQGVDPRWHRLLASHGVYTIVGLLILAVLLWLPSSLLYWMLPIVS